MKEKTLIGSGIVAAIASSLCCIVPLLALIAGGTGAATNLSWMEPFRPYLIGFTILVLGYAWYQKLKPQKDCCINQKTNFMETKTFLTIISIFAIGMLSFPSFSGNFYDNTPIEQGVFSEDSSKVVLSIEGMTCGSCENHINHALNNTKGVISCSSSAKEGTATIVYDNEQLTLKKIKKVISKKTSFKVIGIKDEQ
ncbi:MAG: mercuric transport protein MerTP [Flavobacteriales bacterium]|nr:mercuric transport protein MerTP [Flavobacteriales bacterium]